MGARARGSDGSDGSEGGITKAYYERSLKAAKNAPGMQQHLKVLSFPKTKNRKAKRDVTVFYFWVFVFSHFLRFLFLALYIFGVFKFLCF